MTFRQHKIPRPPQSRIKNVGPSQLRAAHPRKHPEDARAIASATVGPLDTGTVEQSSIAPARDAQDEKADQ
jgi:hypothetical protein